MLRADDGGRQGDPSLGMVSFGSPACSIQENRTMLIHRPYGPVPSRARRQGGPRQPRWAPGPGSVACQSTPRGRGARDGRLDLVASRARRQHALEAPEVGASTSWRRVPDDNRPSKRPRSAPRSHRVAWQATTRLEAPQIAPRPIRVACQTTRGPAGPVVRTHNLVATVPQPRPLDHGTIAANATVEADSCVPSGPHHARPVDP
jgi:hypothetical protein